MFLPAGLILAAAPVLLVFVKTSNRHVIRGARVLFSAFTSTGDLNILPLLCNLAGKHASAIAFGITNMLNTVAGGMGVFEAGLGKANLGLARVIAAAAAI